MSKISELETAISDLRTAAATINDVADTLTGMFSSKDAAEPTAAEAPVEEKQPLTKDEVSNILMGISRISRAHSQKLREPPFICYLLPGANHFAADGIPYFKINEVHIELYTDYKDLVVEQKVEAVLEQYGIFYEKSETWIESEQLYEILYSFDMEA